MKRRLTRGPVRRLWRASWPPRGNARPRGPVPLRCPLPAPGARACRGQQWWCEAVAPKGWRCWQCHPPDHLDAEAVREMRNVKDAALYP
jgi:hypothetical protein